MNNPCKDCTDRRPGCHGSCERYGTFKQEYNERKQRIYDAKATNYERVTWSQARWKKVKGYD